MKNPTENENEWDRRKELEEFENSKLGVKGLSDSGITQIPRIFHHPPETLFDFEKAVRITGDDENIIPVIDMAGKHEEVVEKIRNAASMYGFFQVMNHGIEVELLDRLTGSIRDFYEQSDQEKIKYYNRYSASSGGVSYYSNYEMFYAEKAGSWRDTLLVRFGPTCADPTDIPPICRSVIMEWEKEVKKLGNRLMSILFEGLGLSTDQLNLEAYLKGADMAGQCYPYCPEANKTVGIPSHSDPGSLTILLQDQVGGLQVKYNGQWIDLKPLHGALVINIGDLIQMVSNDVYKSGEHRVYANPLPQPRISVAVFFIPPVDSKTLYGPLPELVTPETPALYRQFTYPEMKETLFKIELKFETLTSYFRVK